MHSSRRRDDWRRQGLNNRGPISSIGHLSPTKLNASRCQINHDSRRRRSINTRVARLQMTVPGPSHRSSLQMLQSLSAEVDMSQVAVDAEVSDRLKSLRSKLIARRTRIEEKRKKIKSERTNKGLMEGKCELSHQVQFIKIIISSETMQESFKCHIDTSEIFPFEH